VWLKHGTVGKVRTRPVLFVSGHQGKPGKPPSTGLRLAQIITALSGACASTRHGPPATAAERYCLLALCLGNDLTAELILARGSFNGLPINQVVREDGPKQRNSFREITAASETFGPRSSYKSLEMPRFRNYVIIPVDLLWG